MLKALGFMVLLFSPLVCIGQTVLVLGDSISAAYGLPSIDRGWVALLQERLAEKGDRVVNTSISGETTAGGLARIDALLHEIKPQVVVIELGANDGLRGFKPAQIRANLNDIITRVQQANAKVLILGMKLPPNYGSRYAAAFEQVFFDLAAERGVAYVPFLMQGVGGEKHLMQQDGLHPNEAAQPILFDHVWRALQSLLAEDKPRAVSRAP